MRVKPLSKNLLLTFLILYAAVTALHPIPHDHSGKVGTPERCLLCQWGQTSKADLSGPLAIAAFSSTTLLALFLYGNPKKETVFGSLTTRAPPVLL